MDTPANAITDAAPPVIAVALAPGALIAGRYRLQTRLGAGGGGTVWRCWDDKLGAAVALKIVSADGDVERWRREVAMARRIASRNVCRVHDLGEAAGLRFVTMELVEGESLRAGIASGLPAHAARDLFAQVVAGTAAIHAAGVVHRDLKPENVVVARDGRAVIVDFGLAREPRGAASITGIGTASGDVTLDHGGAPPPSATVTFAGAVLGTPRYMSPEQAGGQAVDACTDVWALGLIGHELLTGALPAADEHGRRVDPAVDASWRGIAPVLRRCLALLPGERFGDARQLEHALAAIGRRRRRLRWVIGVAAVGAVAGAVIAARTVATDHAGPDQPVPRDEPREAPSRPRLYQRTTTPPRSWPASAPISVALAPDASRFAYTTAEPRLLVRALDGDQPQVWSMPALEKPVSRPTDQPESVLATMWAVGWFSDGSIAILGTTSDGGCRLDRVHADGRTELLHRDTQHFVAAATPVGDRVAIEISESTTLVIATTAGATPAPIGRVGRGEHALAIAWSPDGSRIAVARKLDAPGEAGAIHVMSATGAHSRLLWRGPLAAVAGQLLAWIDEDRLAFAGNDLAAGRARLYTLDVTGATASERDSWPGVYAGVGSAARGRLLLVRGAASHGVQVGDRWAAKLVRLHPRTVRGGHVAGWTSAGEVVFAVGEPGEEQIVLGRAGEALRDWPGTRKGELPDTLAGDELIAHRLDGAGPQILVDGIAMTGERTELARVAAGAAADGLVRCAGDRSSPCVLAETHSGMVRWTEIDPRGGGRGNVLHQRPIRERFAPSAALSPDGKRFAVVDGGPTVTLLELRSQIAGVGIDPQKPPSAGEGAELRSLAFAPSGELWATATSFEGQPFGIMAFLRLDSGRLSSSESSRGKPWQDRLRWFSRPRPSPDGKQVAVDTVELELEVWQVDDL